MGFSRSALGRGGTNYKRGPYAFDPDLPTPGEMVRGRLRRQQIGLDADRATNISEYARPFDQQTGTNPLVAAEVLRRRNAPLAQEQIGAGTRLGTETLESERGLVPTRTETTRATLGAEQKVQGLRGAHAGWQQHIGEQTLPQATEAAGAGLEADIAGEGYRKAAFGRRGAFEEATQPGEINLTQSMNRAKAFAAPGLVNIPIEQSAASAQQMRDVGAGQRDIGAGALEQGRALGTQATGVRDLYLAQAGRAGAETRGLDLNYDFLQKNPQMMQQAMGIPTPEQGAARRATEALASPAAAKLGEPAIAGLMAGATGLSVPYSTHWGLWGGTAQPPGAQQGAEQGAQPTRQAYSWANPFGWGPIPAPPAIPGPAGQGGPGAGGLKPAPVTLIQMLTKSGATTEEIEAQLNQMGYSGHVQVSAAGAPAP